jgi:hypothetical protein
MLTEKEALDLAKRVAEAQGWAWVEPARGALYRAWFGEGGRWEVASNARGLGAIARIVLDAETGAVLDKGYTPR